MKRVPPRFEHLLPVPDRLKPCAERADHTDRRRWFRSSGHIRRRSPYADAHKVAQQGYFPQRLPLHVNLLADARSAIDWPPPPPGRKRDNRQAGIRLGRLHRRDPKNLRCSFLALHRYSVGRNQMVALLVTAAIGNRVQRRSGRGAGAGRFRERSQPHHLRGDAAAAVCQQADGHYARGRRAAR